MKSAKITYRPETKNNSACKPEEQMLFFKIKVKDEKKDGQIGKELIKFLNPGILIGRKNKGKNIN